MTTQSYKRCTHCGVEYVYQGSGPNAPERNHPDWCADCCEVVFTSLRSRPVLFEYRYQSIRAIPRYANITLSQLRQWENDNDADQVKHGSLGIQVRRIFVPMFDLHNGDSQSVREVVGRDEFKGVRFKLATWRHSDVDYEVEVPMEWDCQKACFTGFPWPHGARP